MKNNRKVTNRNTSLVYGECETKYSLSSCDNLAGFSIGHGFGGIEAKSVIGHMHFSDQFSYRLDQAYFDF